MISLIEHVQIKAQLKFAECGRPLKLERWRFKVVFYQGLETILQVEVARRKVRVEIFGIEYGPHISTVQMKVKIRSMVQNSSANPKCREGNFWWECGKCKCER